jgi:hypothetical protein
MSDDICGICYQSTNMIELDCNHQFCNDCLVEYIKTRLNENDNEFFCPYDYCNQEINHAKVCNILSDETESLSEYTKTTNIDYTGIIALCPYCKKICRKESDNYRAYCSNCYATFCSICGESHCAYYYCDNKSEIEESMTEIQSVLYDCKRCPVCRILIEKTEGCSAMRCKYCKIKFCWECLRTYHQIKKLDSHDCLTYDRYAQTNSDDEYTSGSDLDID